MTQTHIDAMHFLYEVKVDPALVEDYNNHSETSAGALAYTGYMNELRKICDHQYENGETGLVDETDHWWCEICRQRVEKAKP